MRLLYTYIYFLFFITIVYTKNINHLSLKCVNVIGFDDSICSGHVEPPKKLCGLKDIDFSSICYGFRFELFKNSCPMANYTEADYCREDFYCGAGKQCNKDDDCVPKKENSLEPVNLRLKQCFSECLKCFDKKECERRVELESVAPENSTEQCSGSLVYHYKSILLLSILLFIVKYIL